MKLKLTLIFLLILLINVDCNNINDDDKPSIEIDDDALILTDQNWDYVHSLYRYIIVFFYSPDCESCEYYDDIFVAAAKKAVEIEHDVKFAFVNASKEVGIRASEEIENYPSTKFYHNKTGVEYLDVMGKDHLITWLTDRIQYELKTIKTKLEGLEVLKSHYLVVFGCILSDKLSDIKDFEIIASLHHDVEFRLLLDPELCQEFGLETSGNSIAIYQYEFDIIHRMSGDQLSRKAMNQFIQHHHVPIFAEHSDFIFTKSFSGHYHYFVTLVFKELPIPLVQMKAEIRSIAKELDGKVIFIHFDSKKKDKLYFLNHLDVPHEDGFRVVESNEHLVIYKPKDPLNVNGTYMLDFIKQVMDGKVDPDLPSSEPQNDWHKELVKPLVQKTFDQLAHDHKKTVFVVLYAPECKFSREVLDIVDKLAEHYKEQDEIDFAKFDITKDRHPRIKVGATPTMFMFLKGSNEKIEFHGKRTFENIKKFIESNGIHGNERQYLEVDHLQHVKLTEKGLRHNADL